jgi:hypothetical protein
VPATSVSAPAATQRGAVSGVTPPSTSRAMSRPVLVDHAAQRGDLRQLALQE